VVSVNPEKRAATASTLAANQYNQPFADGWRHLYTKYERGGCEGDVSFGDRRIDQRERAEPLAAEPWRR
jgi:hypothetical protein